MQANADILGPQVRYAQKMINDLDDDRLEDLLDERVHLLIRINLIENGKPDPMDVASLLKRKLRALEDKIDEARRAHYTGWRARALMREEA